MKRFDFLVRGFYSGTALACLGAAFLAWRDLAGLPSPSLAENVPQKRDATYYAALHDIASEEKNWAVARQAALLETRAAPFAAGGWNRLTYVETVQSGSPGTSALKALLNGYEHAPYPPPAEMRWRVEYAAQYWAAMPDLIQEHTLTQINVLADQGETWDLRHEWCQSFPQGALKSASCQSVGERPRVNDED